MKRLFIIAALMTLLAVVSSVPSQAISWEVGFKGGIALSHLVGADSDSLGADFKPGISGALSVSAFFTDVLGARVEAAFAQKGSEETFIGRRVIQQTTVVTADFDVTNKFDYFEIPVLAVASKKNEAGTARLGAFMGPVFSLNVGAKQTSAAGELETEEDFKDFVKSSDLGLMVGVEGKFLIGDKNWLTLELRYTYGVDSFFNELEVNHSAFQALMGLSIPLGWTYAPVPPPPPTP